MVKDSNNVVVRDSRHHRLCGTQITISANAFEETVKVLVFCARLVRGWSGRPQDAQILSVR